MSDAEARERALGRAREILARPDGWIEAAGGGYRLRRGGDRRRRSLLELDEAGFAALALAPGLKPRPEGGWRAARLPPPPPERPCGRPGVLEGEAVRAGTDGRLARRRVNLGESPVAWLARRRDASGRPWLEPQEAAAAERLRDDFHLAGGVGRLTQAWDDIPRRGRGAGPRVDPVERARAAKARVAAALDAAGPGLRDVLERVCLARSALEAAERSLGLPRRSGKTLLKLALQRLVLHYTGGGARPPSA